jgi:hypothetical protein
MGEKEQAGLVTGLYPPEPMIALPDPVVFVPRSTLPALPLLPGVYRHQNHPYAADRFLLSVEARPYKIIESYGFSGVSPVGTPIKVPSVLVIPRTRIPSSRSRSSERVRSAIQSLASTCISVTWYSPARCNLFTHLIRQSLYSIYSIILLYSCYPNVKKQINIFTSCFP